MLKLILKLRKKMEKIKRKFNIYFELKNYKGNLEIASTVKFNQKIKLYGKGKIKIGRNSSLGYDIGGGFYEGRTELQTRTEKAIIEVGDDVHINNNVFICVRAGIEIKDKCLIGRNVSFLDHNGHGISVKNRHNYPGKENKIILEKNVWVGNNVTILSGTIIGKNSIVGANSVVKGRFPENVIIQGNPAKIVKKIEVSE